MRKCIKTMLTEGHNDKEIIEALSLAYVRIEIHDRSTAEAVRALVKSTNGILITSAVLENFDELILEFQNVADANKFIIESKKIKGTVAERAFPELVADEEITAETRPITKSGKKTAWFRIMEYIYDNPGSKKADIVSVLGIPGLTANRAFSDMIYKQYIQYDSSYNYTLTTVGKKMVEDVRAGVPTSPPKTRRVSFKVGDMVEMVKPSCRYGGSKREFEEYNPRGYAIVTEAPYQETTSIRVEHEDGQAGFWKMDMNDVKLYTGQPKKYKDIKVGDKVVLMRDSYGVSVAAFATKYPQGYGIVTDVRSGGRDINVDVGWSLESEAVEIYNGKPGDQLKIPVEDYIRYMLGPVVEQLGGIWNYSWYQFDSSHNTFMWKKNNIRIGVSVYIKPYRVGSKADETLSLGIGDGNRNTHLKDFKYKLTMNPKKDAIEINSIAGEFITEIDGMPDADVQKQYIK